MRIGKIRAIFGKELLGTFRDRKTILIMVFIPLFLFPIMFVGMGFLMARQMEKTSILVPKVVIQNEKSAQHFVMRLKEHRAFEVTEVNDSEGALRKGSIQLIIEAPDNFDTKMQDDKLAILTILYDEADVKSKEAKRKFEDFIQQYRKDLLNQRLSRRGIDSSITNIIDLRAKNVASSQKMGAFILGTLVPYLIVVLAFTGGMHTAIDITAGEKERGTIETLLVSPIGRDEIVLGKFFTIFSTSLITALLGLVSLLMTFLTGFSVLTFEADMKVTISIISVIIMFLMVLPISWLFSSLLIIIGSIARNNKEAETYATPLLIIITALGMVSVIPGFEPGSELFIVPVMNICLIQQELLMGIFNWGHIFSTLFTTVCAAIASFWIAVRIFSREEVLFRV